MHFNTNLLTIWFPYILLEQKLMNSRGRNLYWVGGTGNTNDSAHYSLISGGAGGQPVPTSIDNVIWDGNSGGGTVTFNAAFTCNNFDSTSFTGTLAGSFALTIAGNFTLGASITRAFTSAITFSATSAGKTITCNSKTLLSTITFNGIGGSWTFQDNFNTGNGITLTNGAINFNSKTITLGTLSSNNSNTRSITCGTATLNLAGGITFTNSTGLTFSAASATFNISSANATIDLGNLAANIGTMNFTGTGANLFLPALTNRSSSDVTIGTLTRSGTIANNLPLALSGNFTITSTLSLVGADARSSRVMLTNANPGMTCQITATGATKTFTNVDFYGITAVGNIPWTGTSMGDAGGNSGITFDSPVTCYLVTSSSTSFWIQQNWSSSSGGAINTIRNPLPQDTAVIDSNSFSASGRTISMSGAGFVPAIDFTNATNNPKFDASTGARPIGNLKLISGMTTAGNGSLSCSIYSGTQTLTTAGISCAFGINILCAGTFALADSPTITGTSGFTFSAGTFNDNNFSPVINTTSIGFSFSFTALNANKIFHKGTGTYSFSNTSPWSASTTALTNLTFTDSGTIKYTDSTSATKTFSPGGLTYNNFWNATTGTGVVVMNSGTTNSTWNDFKINAARTQQFVAGTTTTFSTLTAVGTSGNVITLASSTAANHNLISSSGTAVNCDYMNISHSQASGATFLATNSTDSGNNSGWIIEPSGFLASWNTANIGVSSNNQVQLPFISSGTYNCTVYWGDGTSDVITTWNQAQTLHTYASPGIYKITITGTCTGFQFNNGGDKLKLLNIYSWGPLNLGTPGFNFYGCSNLTITATDILDLTGTHSLFFVFALCTSLTTIPSISSWDFSAVTNMSFAFYGCSSFNQAITANLAACTTLTNCFNGCSVLNSNIVFTNTNLVNDFSFMFDFCYVFNQAGPASFNTSGAVQMQYMYDNCTAFNQDLSGYSINNVTAADHMMDGVTLSNANYNALLVSWAAQTPQNGVNFSAGNSHYSGAGVAAHNTLTGTYAWVITDGGTP